MTATTIIMPITRKITSKLTYSSACSKSKMNRSELMAPPTKVVPRMRATPSKAARVLCNCKNFGNRSSRAMMARMAIKVSVATQKPAVMRRGSSRSGSNSDWPWLRAAISSSLASQRMDLKWWREISNASVSTWPTSPGESSSTKAPLAWLSSGGCSSSWPGGLPLMIRLISAPLTASPWGSMTRPARPVRWLAGPC